MRQIYYRGSLAFCNYDCSYCPFSKNRESGRQRERDRQQLFRFVRKMAQEEFHGAVEIVPYGEALIHTYYWQGMAELGALPDIQAVGAQSNFSFPVRQMLDWYQECGGNLEKLRLWGTFHPEMTSVEAFLRQCHQLQEAGVSFCVGAVGVPGHLESLRTLRSGLDRSVYFWINKMDGLGRPYTAEEKQAWLELDPFFSLEMRHIPADASACEDSVLVQGDGTVRPCINCHAKMGNLYADGLSGLTHKICTRKVCECYLCYGNRNDLQEIQVFSPFAAFRIPSEQAGGNDAVSLSGISI